MFKNFKTGRDPMEKAKQCMKIKFNNILHEKELFFHHVNELIAKIESPFVNLLEEEDRIKFLSGYHEINQELESFLEKLFIIQIILDNDKSRRNAEFSGFGILSNIVSSNGCCEKGNNISGQRNSNRTESTTTYKAELFEIENSLSSDLLINVEHSELLNNNVSSENIPRSSSLRTISPLKKSNEESSSNSFQSLLSPVPTDNDILKYENINQDILNGYMEKSENHFECAFKEMNTTNYLNSVVSQKSDTYDIKLSDHVNSLAKSSSHFVNSPSDNISLMCANSVVESSFLQTTPQNRSIQYTGDDLLHLNSENSHTSQNYADLQNITNSENICDKRNKHCSEYGNSHSDFSSNEFSEHITNIPSCDVLFNTSVPINITYIENLKSFWLQPNKKQFEELLINLQTVECVKYEHSVTAGQYFLAPYVKDNFVHRVKVLKLTSEQQLLVHYIDYGNKDSILPSSLQLLPSFLAGIPSQAILCFLEKVPPEGMILDLFREFVPSKSLYAVISPPVEERYPVKLYVKLSNGNESFQLVDVIQYILSSIKNSLDIPNDVLDSSFSSKSIIAVKPANDCGDAKSEKLKESEYKVLLDYDSDCGHSSNMSAVEESFLNDAKREMLEYDINFHKNWNLIVPQPDILSTKDDNMLIMLSYIANPSEFYANNVSWNNYLLDTLEEKMNIFYEAWNMKYKINADQLICPGIFCCCKDIDGKWYRVKVIEEIRDSNEELNVVVHCIDYGDTKKLSKKCILPLLPVFARLPAFALHCSLAYIESIETRKDRTWTWPKRTTERFFELTGFQNIFNAKIVSYGEAEEKFPLKVIIWKTETKSINSILVEEGLALSLDVSLNNNKAFNIGVKGGADGGGDNHIIDTWDPMADDFLSERNSYKIDVDDLGIALTGYKSKHKETICTHFVRGGKCLWGESCKYKHIYTEDALTLDKEKIFSCNIDLDIPEHGNYLLVQVTAVYNPCHFYITFPYGPHSVYKILFQQWHESFSLDELVKNMSKYYAKKRTNKDLLYGALGSIVAAKSNVDGKWYRGRIRNINETERICEVFLVDFGNCEWINENNIEDIDPTFMDFPFQAVECHLANVNINMWKEDNYLTRQAWNLFRRLTEGKVLVAFILEKDEVADTVLYVNLYTMDGILINEEFIKPGLAEYSLQMY